MFSPTFSVTLISRPLEGTHLFRRQDDVDNVARVHIEWIHQEIVQEPRSSDCQKSLPICLNHERVRRSGILHPIFPVAFWLFHFQAEVEDRQWRKTTQTDCDPPHQSQMILREDGLMLLMSFEQRLYHQQTGD
jgi:hypothetical protein